MTSMTFLGWLADLADLAASLEPRSANRVESEGLHRVETNVDIKINLPRFCQGSFQLELSQASKQKT